MPEEDPRFYNEALIIPRPVTGHRRQVQVAHPYCGSGNLLTTDASWSDAQQPNYINYALTPPRGPKQRTLHTGGANEITWNIGGELTNNTMGLLRLLDSNARGVNFRSIIISQGPQDTIWFNNPDLQIGVPGYFLPWSNFSVSGSQNGAVTFTLEGKSTQIPFPYADPAVLPFPDVPVPSWYTGNEFVTAWTLSHTVNLSPFWANTISPFPLYYRPGHSEISIQVTTKVWLQEHFRIKFGIGKVDLIECVVTSRNRTFGSRNEPPTYQATTSSVWVSHQEAFEPSVFIDLQGGPVNAGIY